MNLRRLQNEWVALQSFVRVVLARDAFLVLYIAESVSERFTITTAEYDRAMLDRWLETGGDGGTKLLSDARIVRRTETPVETLSVAMTEAVREGEAWLAKQKTDAPAGEIVSLEERRRRRRPR